MDSTQFDQFTKAVTGGLAIDALRSDFVVGSLVRNPSSRRAWFAGLATGLFSSLALAGDVAEAKRKKRRRHKKRKHKTSACEPNCTGGPCRDDGCGGICPCDAPGVCSSTSNVCCNPEGTPCASGDGCCSGTCDFLVDSGSCSPCAGRSCNAEQPCCGGLECISGYCDGCRDRAVSCSSPSQCCFSDCTGGACLSSLGGPCARDVDCRKCYLENNCTNACVAGACTV